MNNTARNSHILSLIQPVRQFPCLKLSVVIIFSHGNTYGVTPGDAPDSRVTQEKPVELANLLQRFRTVVSCWNDGLLGVVV